MKNFTFIKFDRKVIQANTFVLLILAFVVNSSFTYSTISEDISPVFIDTDGDGIENEFDIDDDGDGILDTIEGTTEDSDEDGILNYLDLDSDNDGIQDNVEAQSSLSFIAPTNLDVNSNGLSDVYESNGANGLLPIDSDNDEVPDYLDIDSDGDGLLDGSESSVLSTDFDCDTIQI